jgi:hypothetical protein
MSGRLIRGSAERTVDWFNGVDASYRSDLRETNELNFARFMASVDQRFAEQDTRIERRFAELEVRLERRFATTDARLADLRTDLLKWMFIYWTGTMLSLAGFVFAMLQRG